MIFLMISCKSLTENFIFCAVAPQVFALMYDITWLIDITFHYFDPVITHSLSFKPTVGKVFPQESLSSCSVRNENSKAVSCFLMKPSDLKRISEASESFSWGI